MNNKSYRQPEDNTEDAIRMLNDEQLDQVSGGHSMPGIGNTNIGGGLIHTEEPYTAKTTFNKRFG